LTERWHAIHTIPRSEYVADLKLRGLGYKTFFPHTVELVAQSKRKSRFVKIAYLTRYTFVAFRPERAHLESAFQINSLTNKDGDYLCRMVVNGSGDGTPFPIPLDVMQPLFDLCDLIDGQVFDRNAPKPKWAWAVDDRIRLGDNTGALRGLAAAIEHISDDGESLRVRLERTILGQDVVTVRSRDVDEVEAAASK
jgi:hypothetical protein